MKQLAVLNNNDFEPKYEERKTVRAVIKNKEGEVLLFNGLLVGGGVENGETDEEALHREALEETGAQIEITRPLGTVIGYRDMLQKKYILNGYECRFVKTISSPTSTQEDERGLLSVWEHIDEAITRLQREVEGIKNIGKEKFTQDQYQVKIFNRQVSLIFLQETRNFI